MPCRITEHQRKTWKAEEEAKRGADEIEREQQETRDRIRRGGARSPLGSQQKD